MKFGVPIGNFGQFGKLGTARDQVRIAAAAERLGFDSVWVHDHIVMPARIRARYPYNDSGVAGFAWRQDIYDPIAMLSALAIATERVEIGTSVLIIPYRNPVVLAKMLATVDQLARGRLRLGIGVGWMQEEFEALGIGEWYPIRGRVTDEWIAVCKELWSRDGASSFAGRFVSFHDIGAYPKPVRQHIPIWVGGWGDVAARRVARYGDGFQTISSTPAMVAEQLACVRTELERRGRTLDQIEVSMLGGIRIGAGDTAAPLVMIGGSRQEIIDRLGEYREAGLQHLIATPRRVGAGPFTPDGMIEDMQYLAEEIFPALR
ncbi:MAG: LLM class F420-dependent oxidoreductase [Dehalococcoidia bacterium]